MKEEQNVEKKAPRGDARSCVCSAPSDAAVAKNSETERKEEGRVKGGEPSDGRETGD